MTKLSKTQALLVLAFALLNLIIFYSLYKSFEIIPEPQSEQIEIDMSSLESVNELITQSKYNEAVMQLNQLTTDDPLFADAYLLWQEILLKYDKKDEAIDVLNKAITNNVSDDRIFLALADIKYMKGDWAAALDLYFLLYERNPQNSAIIRKYINTLIVLNEDDRLKEIAPKLDPYLSSEMRIYKNVLSYSYNMSEPDLLLQGIEDLDTNQALLLQSMKQLSVDPAQTDSYVLGLSQMVYELISNSYLELGLHFDRKLINENSFFEKPNLYAASIFIRLNSPDHALPHILRCLKFNPESIPCHILMIEHHYANSDSEKLAQDVPMVLDLLASNSQDQVFALLAIFDKNMDYANVLKYAEDILSRAPNYYREIDFMAMKAALMIKDWIELENYTKRVSQFEIVLTASERSLYLSSKYMLELLNGDVLSDENIEMVTNIDSESIYPQILLHAYYTAINSEDSALVAAARAEELDLSNDIPELYFNKIAQE